MAEQKNTLYGMNLSEKLAVDRTALANERTLLAYLRSFLVILSSGVAIMKIEVLQKLKALGYFFLILAPILFIIGIVRFYIVNKRLHVIIKKYSNE